MRIWAMLGAVGALSACAPATPAPELTIEELYSRYVGPEAGRAPSSWRAAPVYSDALKSAIDRGVVYGHLLAKPVIDYDPIVNGPDSVITKLSITVDTPPSGRGARVTARFTNSTAVNAVHYDLIKEDGVWKIDAIRSGARDLRQHIEDALKPAGDPEEMAAPIRMIYEMYAPPHSGASESLYRWAPVSKSFAALLEDAAKRGEGGKDGVTFDPVTNGQTLEGGSINLEPVRSAVIVRLTGKDGANPQVIVYDLIEEAGTWKIFNIRAPDASPAPWDMRALLTPAPAVKTTP